YPESTTRSSEPPTAAVGGVCFCRRYRRRSLPVAASVFVALRGGNLRAECAVLSGPPGPLGEGSGARDPACTRRIARSDSHTSRAFTRHLLSDRISRRISNRISNRR